MYACMCVYVCVYQYSYLCAGPGLHCRKGAAEGGLASIAAAEGAGEDGRGTAAEAGAGSVVPPGDPHHWPACRESHMHVMVPHMLEAVRSNFRGNAGT